MLKISSLTKSFQGKTIFKDLNLNLQQGEVTVLVGESGVGKSTLLRCLTGLESIESGQMILDDKVIEISQQQFHLQGQIGLVFQNFNLFPHLSVLENLTLTPVQQLKVSKHEAQERALALLDFVNLSDKADYYPHELSGGQQQRIAIARACAINPNVLCFDEPTSALDPHHTQMIINLLKDLKHQGLTILIITHDLTFAAQVADRLITLKHGQLIEGSLNF